MANGVARAGLAAAAIGHANLGSRDSQAVVTWCTVVADFAGSAGSACVSTDWWILVVVAFLARVAAGEGAAVALAVGWNTELLIGVAVGLGADKS